MREADRAPGRSSARPGTRGAEARLLPPHPFPVPFHPFRPPSSLRRGFIQILFKSLISRRSRAEGRGRGRGRAQGRGRGPAASYIPLCSPGVVAQGRGAGYRDPPLPGNRLWAGLAPRKRWGSEAWPWTPGHWASGRGQLKGRGYNICFIVCCNSLSIIF